RIRSRRSPAAPARTLLPIFTTARRTRRRSRALWACWSIYSASHTWRLILLRLPHLEAHSLRLPHLEAHSSLAPLEARPASPAARRVLLRATRAPRRR